MYVWYDGLICVMDVEIFCIFEWFEEYDIVDDMFFVFIIDYGEEFLEYGDLWYGYLVYGEMV